MNLFIAALAIAALWSDTFHGVDAAAAMSNEIRCLPEAQQVCVVGYRWTSPNPSTYCVDPADVTTCQYEMVGGYSWSFRIVENLVDGSKTESEKAMLEAAANGLEVFVSMDDGKFCEISVGDESCSMCSGNCTDASGAPTSGVQYDCTNLMNGKSSGVECVSLDDPFLYLFLLESKKTLADSNLEELFGTVPPSSANRITLIGIVFSAMMLSVAFICFMA